MTPAKEKHCQEVLVCPGNQYFVISEMPVIATPMGTIPELVTDSWKGFIVEAGNAHAIADRMSHFITHPHLIEEMGRNGRSRIEETYSEESAFTTLADIIEEAYLEKYGGQLIIDNCQLTIDN